MSLKELLDSDDGVIKLSPLTRAAVFPKPIERQNVALVLRVFSDETVAALRIKFAAAGKLVYIFMFNLYVYTDYV